MLYEKKFEIKDDNIKISLFKFFNNTKNIESYNKILKKESFNFLLDQKQEAMKEILLYYISFFPESMKKEIELIKSGQINDDNLEDYIPAKKFNLRKPFVFSLINEKMEQNEKEINIAKEKWIIIEKAINENQFNEINIKDKVKFIKFFENKDNEENKFIKEIFTEEIIESFIKEDFEKNVDKNDKINYSQRNINNTIIKPKTGMIDENEEEEIYVLNKNDLIKKNIFKKHLIIKLYLQNNKIVIKRILLNGKIIITENDLIKCEEEFSKEENSQEYKIFKFINEFKEELIKNYKNNFKLNLELFIGKKEKSFYCMYVFIPPRLSKEENPPSFIDNDITINSISEGFQLLLMEINKKNYSIKNESFNLNIKKINIKNKFDSTKNEQKEKYDQFNYYLPQADKYQILLFIKIIGNHNKRKRTFTAEYIKELKKSKRFISGGTDNSLKLYDANFKEDETNEVTEIDEWPYSLYVRKNGDIDFSQFIVTTNKEIYLFSLNEQFEYSKWQLPNMKNNSSIEMKVKIKEKEKSFSRKRKKKKGNKEDKEEKIIDYYIVAGRKGVIFFDTMFQNLSEEEKKEKEKNNFNIEEEVTYRSIIQINENEFAASSNAILSGGEDKLIIYDLSDKTIQKVIKGYSFVTSDNGLYLLSQNILLCACKKYLQNQKNGILLILLNNNDNSEAKSYFFDTEEFEVYCFCPIKQKNKEIFEETDYFFVGGFDNKFREGKIKLYKLIKNEKNLDKMIQFLQDIEFEETEEILIEEEIKNNLIKNKFNGFDGAVNSIIQASETGNILASCYDGRIYLFSKPNLEKYIEEKN